MANIELIDKDRKGPMTSICPHCKRKMVFSIDMFRNDITKIIQSDCPYCKGKIFACILILSNATMPRLLSQLKRVIEAAEGKNNVIKV